MNISPWAGMLLVLVGLALVVGIGLLLQRRFNPHPEVLRKVAHVLMGCIALSFPWLFADVWPVMMIGITSVAMTLAVKKVNTLKTRVGSILYGVKRQSLGELFFPVSVMILFYLAAGDKILYSVPVLMLTFADSTAALIGSSYGRYGLATAKEDPKSVEGSFAFFWVAFMSTLVPVLLYTDVGRAESLLLSLIIGLLAALIEMVSSGGIDNLLIPLMSYAFLVSHLHLNLAVLQGQFVFLFILAVFAFIWNLYGSFSKLGIIGGLVATYIISILGGAIWFFAPVSSFVSYSILPAYNRAEKKRVLNYHVIDSNMAVGLVWVWMSTVSQQTDSYFSGFTFAFACQLGMNTYNRLTNFHKCELKPAVLFSLAKAVFFVLGPGLLLGYQCSATTPTASIVVVMLVGLVAGIFASIILRTKCRFHYKAVNARGGWANSAVVLVLSGLVILIKQEAGW